MLMQVVFYIKECDLLHTWGTTHFHSRSVALHTWVTHLHLRHVAFSIHESLIYIQGEWHSPNVRHSITSKESGTQLHPGKVALIYVQGMWHSPYMSQSFTSKESGSLQVWDTQLHQRSVAFSLHEALIFLLGVWHSQSLRYSWSFSC